MAPKNVHNCAGAVNVLDFPNHVARLHADSDIGFSREYNEILRYSSDGVNATSEHSQHPDNKHKNRYGASYSYTNPTSPWTVESNRGPNR